MTYKPCVVKIHIKHGKMGWEALFDVSEPMPWPHQLIVSWCPDCCDEGDAHMRRDEVPALIEEIAGQLQPAHDAHRLYRVRDGAATVDLDGASDITGFGRTKIADLIAEGRFPKPLYVANGRRWLVEEVSAAMARIIAEDTSRVRAVDAARRRPTNRHERRKLASGSK